MQVLFFLSIIRGVSRWWGAGCAVVLATLRCQVSVRIMPAGFLCPTKPSKLAIHGSISPCLDISVLYSIILQTLNSCAIRPPDSTACPHHRLTPLTLRYNVLVLTCGSDSTVLSACTWEAPILRCFPLDTLYSPDGMQCVLKKIMNCHEVPYSLLTQKAPAYPQTNRTWARG